MGLHAPSASLATMAMPWPGTVGVSVTKMSLICIAIILSQLSTVFTKSTLVLGLGIRCLLAQIELLIEMITITRCMLSHVFGLCAPVHQAVHV